MKAVIDRIENDTAVILIGDDEVVLDVPLALLPEGSTEGTWLRVDFLIDEHSTNEHFRKNKFLLDRLIRKGNADKRKP
jgi:hypothetical protein